MPNIRVIGSVGNAALILEWDDGAGIVKTALVLRHELTETRNPVITDDDSLGFARGSFWFNASTLTAWICLAPTTGNAQWRQIAGGGGSVGTSVALVIEASSNITIGGGAALPTIDGYSVQDGNRVLLTAQTSADENGLWVARTIGTAWVRPTDFAVGDHAAGRIVFIVKGTTFADTLWVCTTDAPNDVIDTDNLAFEQIAQKTETQIIYVGKHGNDSSTGKTIVQAKLTFAAAITAAGTPGSEAAAVTIVCLDDGEYTENLTHVGFVYVYAPNVTLKGSHSFASGVHRLVARRLLGTSSTAVITVSTGSSEVFVDVERIDAVTGISTPVQVGTGGGPLYLKVGKIDSTAAGSQGGILVLGGAVAYLDVSELFVRDLRALEISGNGEIYGRIGRLHGQAGSTGLKVSGAGTGVMRLHIGEINCPTAWNINQANADVKVFCDHVAGTRIETAGKVRVVEAIKHNFAATTDPAITDDDSDGYSVGSVWVNVSTDKAYICLDASTGTAVWQKLDLQTVRTIQTTDATVTTIATIPIPDDTAIWIETNVINRRTNAADRGKWKRGALVFREAAGAATLEGSVWTPLTVKSVVPAVWDCTITVSGNNALVQVTGAVGHDLNWESRHTLEERS